MTKTLKSSFLWQVTSGFLLGVVGMLALQPADATRALVGHLAPHIAAHQHQAGGR